MTIEIFKPVLFSLFAIWLWAGCEKTEQTEDICKPQDYPGKYSGTLTRERLAPNGWITRNSFVEKIPTEVEITRSLKGSNLLMVYVSAYHDSILCEFDESTGYIRISDKPHSFYWRISDFPEFKGFYDEAVSTYGHLGYRDTDNKTTLWIGFIKDMNDSIYMCNVATIKLN